MATVALERVERESSGPGRRGTGPPLPPLARVLLVDGNHGSRCALAELLEGEGFEVHSAASAFEGLALVEDFQPDVALIDLQLPVMNGLEFLQQLRQAGLSVPALMITGGAYPAMQRQSRCLGAVDVIEKPLDVDDVVLRLRSALALRPPRPLAHA